MKDSIRNAVIYARVSSVGNRQNTDRQVADLSIYAAKNDYHVCKVFTEHISGAKKNTEREGLQSCMKFVTDKENDVKVILVSEMSRLGRSIDEVQKTILTLKDHHINVYFQKENFFLLDETGQETITTRVLVFSFSMCAELERENIKFRLQSGLAQYRASGGKVGRNTGYQKPKETYLEEYPELIEKLKERKNHLDNGIRDKDDSVRSIASAYKVNVSTIQVIRKLFNL